MKKFADVEEWRESVKKEIQSNGVHIVAKSTACDCEECLKEGISKGNSYTSLLDGYVHSIGFHQQGLPEIIILAGSNGVEETELTKEQVLNRVEDASNFLNTIYQTRDTFVFDKEKAYGSPNINGLYWVIMDNEELDADEFVKHELMSSATDYYNDCQYKFIIFKPHIHHN